MPRAAIAGIGQTEFAKAIGRSERDAELCLVTSGAGVPASGRRASRR